MKHLRWLLLAFPIGLALLGGRRIYWYAKSAEPVVVPCAQAERSGLPLRSFVRLEGCEADLDHALVEEWKHARRGQGTSLEMLVPTWAGNRPIAVVHLRGEHELGTQLRTQLDEARDANRRAGRIPFTVEGWVADSTNFNASEQARISEIPGFETLDEVASFEQGGRPGWTGGAMQLGAAALFGLTFVQIFRTRRRS